MSLENGYVRIIPELRASQLAEFKKMGPQSIYYLKKSWDLGELVVPPFCRKVSRFALLFLVFRSRARVLETFEPLWVRHLGLNISILLCWKLGAFVFRRKRFTVMFALENNDFDLVIFGRNANPVASKIAKLILSSIYRNAFNRIAYGSHGSSATYSGLLAGSALPDEQIFPDLFSEDKDNAINGDNFGCVFVGRLEERKGIRLLMELWERVERIHPTASITIVGDGPLRPVVDSWVNGSTRRRATGHVPSQSVKSILKFNRILVAPSIRWGRWREQISLPVCEALSLGLSIATSMETGLAKWLASNGHLVFDTATETNVISDSLVGLIIKPLDPKEVLATLPVISGRVAASHWLREVAEEN